MGARADRVLIAQGAISEETFAAAFADWYGLPFEPLTGRPREATPVSNSQLVEAAVTGLLPLQVDGGLDFVVVPDLVDSRRLATALASGSELARRLRITSLLRLQRFVAQHAGEEIGHRAGRALHAVRPELSSRGGPPLLAITLMASAMAGAAIVAPQAVLVALEIVLGFMFLAWTALRLFGVFGDRLVHRRLHPIDDRQLPIYTIVVPLYREATAVRGLIAALRRLDYPVEKLDIKIVVEADDRETRAEISELRLGAPFEVVIAPRSGPRTKPKALNTALPFARGSFIAVFDAEDRPEPNQLRLAIEAFAGGNRRLACVQARLTIDNTDDSWLARLFTAEYAGLFDVFLPALAGWRLPLPLGGSSNHFRTATLRAIGAWDPFNVTEDADLGTRLARFGYRTAVIPSTTYEEAPARLWSWLRQRTRWFKGWLQTWLVHMRSPRRLLAELGWPGFVVFQLMVGGTVLAALVHSLFAAALAWQWAAAWLEFDSPNDMAGFYAVTLLGGYLASALISVVGLARRKLLRCSWVLLLMPLYWLLLSMAAWRALFQLLRHPYRWEKTEHGLARTSRLATKRNAARGTAVRSPPEPTGSGADRRPRPRVGA